MRRHCRCSFCQTRVQRDARRAAVAADNRTQEAWAAFCGSRRFRSIEEQPAIEKAASAELHLTLPMALGWYFAAGADWLYRGLGLHSRFNAALPLTASRLSHERYRQWAHGFGASVLYMLIHRKYARFDIISASYNHV